MTHKMETSPTRNVPVPVVTQEEEPPPEPTATTDSDLYEYNGILSHQPAQRGSGSKYEVEVDWKNYPPSYVPVNIFTDRGKNPTAWDTVAEYATNNNLINTKGWRQFQQQQSTPTTPSANLVQNRLNKNCREFFEVCLHAQEKAKKSHQFRHWQII